MASVEMELKYTDNISTTMPPIPQVKSTSEWKDYDILVEAENLKKIKESSSITQVAVTERTERDDDKDKQNSDLF